MFLSIFDAPGGFVFEEFSKNGIYFLCAGLGRRSGDLSGEYPEIVFFDDVILILNYASAKSAFACELVWL